MQFGNIEELKEKWVRDGIISISNFLPECLAQEIADSVYKIPEPAWKYSCHPYLPNCYTFDNTPQNAETIQAAIKSARHAHDIGQFSYNFRRVEYDSIFYEILKSKEFFDTIYEITNLKVESTISVFASCYEAGSFLTIHTDTGRGNDSLCL